MPNSETWLRELDRLVDEYRDYLLLRAARCENNGELRRAQLIREVARSDEWLDHGLRHYIAHERGKEDAICLGER